jgi:archaellum component FlaF (FlaF/FlaG flagellin family)
LGRGSRRVTAGAIAVAVLMAAGVLALREVRGRWLAPPPSGRLTVTSLPPRADVSVDGVWRGVTPLTIELPTGGHKVSLRAAGVTRDLSIDAKPNMEIVQAIELAPPAPTLGALSVTSEPPGIRLTIDGTPRGTTPALIAQLPPGQHRVTLAAKNVTTDRTVTIEAGSTATLMISMPVENVATGVGSVTLSSPIDVQLFEGDTLVGSSRSARLFLPAGAHTITAVNETLGYKHAIPVNVKAGGSATVTVPIPNGSLSVNAQPWAEVLVDGRSLGETPIGNYALPIGSHELVIRHPQLGERRQTVVVGAGRPVRIGLDLRK